MPEKETVEKARQDEREGKSPSTQAGEFVHEEIEHVREGKHGARSTKQAIAIGLSKARRAGVKVGAPKRGRSKASTRKSAKSSNGSARSTSPKRSRAAREALEHEPRDTASHDKLSRHARSAARSRSASERSAAAKKAARTRKRK